MIFSGWVSLWRKHKLIKHFSIYELIDFIEENFQYILPLEIKSGIESKQKEIYWMCYEAYKNHRCEAWAYIKFDDEVWTFEFDYYHEDKIIDEGFIFDLSEFMEGSKWDYTVFCLSKTVELISYTKENYN